MSDWPEACPWCSGSSVDVSYSDEYVGVEPVYYAGYCNACDEYFDVLESGTVINPNDRETAEIRRRMVSDYPWSSGPWDWEPNYMGEPGDSCLHNESHDIAVIPSKGMPDAPDAALIALAPEMADAILAACDVNDSGDGILSSHPVRDVLDALRDRIEAIGGTG